MLLAESLAGYPITLLREHRLQFWYGKCPVIWVDSMGRCNAKPKSVVRASAAKGRLLGLIQTKQPSG
jgi:hypothetical protein